MPTLDMSEATEVRLTLRGVDENSILETMRHLPFWKSMTVERDPDNEERYLAITLIADRAREPIVREILARSFHLSFPSDGGSQDFVAVPTVPALRRRASRA